MGVSEVLSKDFLTQPCNDFGGSQAFFSFVTVNPFKNKTIAKQVSLHL